MSLLVAAVGRRSGGLQERSFFYFVERADRQSFANFDRPLLRLLVLGLYRDGFWNCLRNCHRLGSLIGRSTLAGPIVDLFLFVLLLGCFFGFGLRFRAWPRRVVRIFVGQKGGIFYDYRRDVVKIDSQ